MRNSQISAVTGAFSYTGKYIARRLLSQGEQVITLTGHPNRPDPFDGAIPAYPYQFNQPGALEARLEGVATLYNTYWVRFNHGETSFAEAVENTRTLLRAAERVGVKRIVHISISNPSLDSPLPYFRGKALIEAAILESHLSHAILRPTVIFGKEDILINNIAFLLRHFPLFAIPGDGNYRLQPVFVEDVADIAVKVGQQDENIILDAVGPETYPFNELVRLLARSTGSRPWIIHVPAWLALRLSWLIGWALRDVLLTQQETDGLMANLLVSDQHPSGHTSLRAWLEENRNWLGKSYASELKRHF
jgi:uncharacterized protein YbjT (DUF2867 family)